MYQFILIVHIIAGTIALASGLLAIIVPKGKKPHILSGTWFYITMYIVGISAVIMTFMKWNPFLLSIGIFSAYLTYSGRQAILYWRLKQAYNPGLKEKLPVLLAFFTALVMTGYPLYRMVTEQAVFLSIQMVFGCIMLVFTIQDLILLRKADNFRPGNKAWLYKHISMMGGAYISTVTAFLVVNLNGMVAGWIPWLAPTIIGSLLITITIWRWQAKLNLSMK